MEPHVAGIKPGRYRCGKQDKAVASLDGARRASEADFASHRHRHRLGGRVSRGGRRIHRPAWPHRHRFASQSRAATQDPRPIRRSYPAVSTTRRRIFSATYQCMEDRRDARSRSNDDGLQIPLGSPTRASPTGIDCLRLEVWRPPTSVRLHARARHDAASALRVKRRVLLRRVPQSQESSHRA